MHHGLWRAAAVFISDFLCLQGFSLDLHQDQNGPSRSHVPVKVEALMGEEAEGVFQAGEQEEVEEVHQPKNFQNPHSWIVIEKNRVIALNTYRFTV